MATTTIVFGAPCANAEEPPSAPKEADAASKTATTPRYSVPLKDMRSDEPGFVHKAAMVLSAGETPKVVVVYYGNNEYYRNEARHGASTAKDQGYPVRGMILAPGTADTVRIYYAGQVVTKADLGPLDLRRLVRRAIELVHEELVPLVEADRAPATSK